MCIRVRYALLGKAADPSSYPISVDHTVKDRCNESLAVLQEWRMVSNDAHFNDKSTHMNRIEALEPITERVSIDCIRHSCTLLAKTREV